MLWVFRQELLTSKTPDEISVGWDAALPRFCTYAKFRDKKSGENFWVFNTHFNHVGERAREESAGFLVMLFMIIQKKVFLHVSYSGR